MMWQIHTSVQTRGHHGLEWDLSITDTIGTNTTVPYLEVSLIQRLNNTVMYCCDVRASVLNGEVSFIQSVCSTVYDISHIGWWPESLR